MYSCCWLSLCTSVIIIIIILNYTTRNTTAIGSYTVVTGARIDLSSENTLRRFSLAAATSHSIHISSPTKFGPLCARGVFAVYGRFAHNGRGVMVVLLKARDRFRPTTTRTSCYRSDGMKLTVVIRG